MWERYNLAGLDNTMLLAVRNYQLKQRERIKEGLPIQRLALFEIIGPATRHRPDGPPREVCCCQRCQRERR
jgi:hypothetical protein